MKGKTYKLRNDFKYPIPTDKRQKSFYDSRTYINRRKLQKAFDYRNKLIKKYKKPKKMNSFVLALLLLAFYYLLIGLVILMSKCGGF